MKVFAPKQARSRESLERLMKAARELLNEKGLEGTTVPRVAARAGLSPASVYRRFPDKDALMRAVVLQTMESFDAKNAAALTPALADKLTLRDFAEIAVRQSLAHQRQNAKMLLAMQQFILTHPSLAFRKKAAEVSIRSVQRVAEFLQLKRHEITHPNPKAAAAFALMIVGFTVQDVVVLDVLPGMKDPRLPENDEELIKELVRVFLSYLGCERIRAQRA